MGEYSVVPGLFVLLFLAPVAMAAWILMLWFPLRLWGISLKAALDEITIPEAILFGLYAVGASHVVYGVFSRFV